MTNKIHYTNENYANICARYTSKQLGVYVTVGKDAQGFYLSLKYAQGSTPKS